MVSSVLTNRAKQAIYFISVSGFTSSARDLCLGDSDSANKLFICLSERQKGERERTVEEEKRETDTQRDSLVCRNPDTL